MLNTTLKHAQNYAELGINTLPLHYITNGICSCGGAEKNPKCKPGKHPYGNLAPHGVNDASTDPGRLKEWFDGKPYNIGIATGDASGFFVLDRDDKDGGDKTLAVWEKENGVLPKTLMQRTGNGRHYLFKMPVGIDIRNIQKKIDCPGLDVRGNGGYICAAPTMHFSGKNYEWIDSEFMDFTKIVAAPTWLIDKITSKTTKPISVSADAAPFTGVFSLNAFKIPEKITDGQGRESFLLQYAGHLRGKGQDQSTIDQILLDYNQLHISPPLDHDLVLNKARRYLTEEPRVQPNTLVENTDDYLIDPVFSIWDKPQEIKESMPPVPAFDYELLPAALRPWVKDIAERMQCPPDYLAVGAIVAAGALVGNKIGIQPKQLDSGWVETPNLWGAVIGRPGVMKTPALSQVLAPLKEIEQQASVAHGLVMSKFELDKMHHEVSLGKVKEQVKKGATIEATEFPVAPEEPQPKRYLINDATYQKLGDVLKHNCNGLMVFQDELAGLLMRLDSDGQESARAFYLQAWDGKQPYTFDRIGRGTISIPMLCFSMLGGIQPGKIRDYLRSAVNGGKGDDGLVQRIQLLVYPDIVKEWSQVDRLVDKEAQEAAYAIYHNLAELDPISIGAINSFSGVQVLKFDEQAQGLFNQWWSKLEHGLRRGSSHPALESHFSKYRKLIPSLALLDHLINGRDGFVRIDSIARAIQWHLYLGAHAKRAYSVVTSASTDSAKALYDKLKKGVIKDEFTARDVYRNSWSLLTSVKEVTEAAELLVDHGWLRAYIDKIPGAEGRPTVRYIINPLLKKAA